VRGAFALGFLIVLWQPAAQSPIHIRLSQRTCAPPCSLTATVVIPNHPDNRHASLVWGYDASESTDWTIDRETSRVEFAIPIRNLTKGDHKIYAVLLRETNGQTQTFEDSQNVTVR
jgi:hypothetical protein